MKPKYFAVAAIAILTFAIAYPIAKYISRSQSFEKLHPGMSKQQVLSLFGKPDLMEKAYDPTPAWDQEPLKGNYEPVIVEWTYWSPLPKPEGWLVGFDAHGVLVKRVNLVSF